MFLNSNKQPCLLFFSLWFCDDDIKTVWKQDFFLKFLEFLLFGDYIIIRFTLKVRNVVRRAELPSTFTGSRIAHICNTFLKKEGHVMTHEL